jgi:hypothetical protein
MTLSHGSRHSVLVQLDKAAKDYTIDYTIRVAGDGLNQKVFGSALLSYAYGSHKVDPKPSINYAGANTTADVRFLKDRTVVPFPAPYISPSVDSTYKLLINHTGFAWEWTLNANSAFNESLEDMTPLLWDPTPLKDLTITTKNGTWVDMIFDVTSTAGLQ